MDPLADQSIPIAFTAWTLLLLLNSFDPPRLAMGMEAEDTIDEPMQDILQTVGGSDHDAQSQMRATLNHFRLFVSFNFLDDDIGYWVKPRSTTWFSRFLLEQYDNSRWVQMFRMTKPAVIALSDVLRPHVERHNTRYRLAIPVLIRVACTLFKLTHGANTTVCSEMFAIGRSTVSMVLREVVHAINETLRHQIMWPTGQRLRETEAKFNQLCGLPGVVGAIDGFHVAISKPQEGPADYYYFKSGGYTINCQAVVDSEKRFLDLYLGMPGSTNDSRMLRRSSLYNLGMNNTLMTGNHTVSGFSPYIIGDLGYPLLPWLMVPYKSDRLLSVSERLFNKRLRRGRCVVENAFGILKQSFRELLVKTDLHVTFLPDVIMACAILHNILLGQSHEEVEELLQVLRTEGLDGAVEDEEGNGVDDAQGGRDAPADPAATVKRAQLGVFLSTQRRQQA